MKSDSADLLIVGGLTYNYRVNPRHGWRRSATLSVLSLAVLASACLNDRDSLEYGFGDRDVMLVATGWFPQNPPEFYQMRIDRLLKASNSRPLSPSEYDDISVAYDRIGKDDDALKWIQKKGELMDHHRFKGYDIQPLEGSPPEPWNARNRPHHIVDSISPTDYHRYSLHANWGTFLIHRWIRAGMPLARVAEASEADNQLNDAIEINPEAHAGREIVQIAIIDWLIKERQGSRHIRPELVTGSQTIKGLSGLVELGAAWNSYEVFALMTQHIHDGGGQAMAFFRAKEILVNGGKPVTDVDLLPPEPRYIERYQDTYNHLRETAKQAISDRFKFMRSQFSKGKHPDTDVDFWRGYSAPERPVVYLPWPARLLAYAIEIVINLLGCVWIPILLFVVMKIAKGKKGKPTSISS